MANPPIRPNAHGGQGQLRIIGGEWRSRRFSFPDAEGLRPTPDRVRETLFNWLAPYLSGARVLDPFTGSGAIYLEALSRGASMALALDVNANAIASLRKHLDTLNCGHGQPAAERCPALSGNSDADRLRPVFSTRRSTRICCNRPASCWRTRVGWPHAWVYTESEALPSSLGLPGNWRLHREKQAGKVFYALWERQAPASQPPLSRSRRSARGDRRRESARYCRSRSSRPSSSTAARPRRSWA